MGRSPVLNVNGTIKNIQNIMRKDAGVDGDAQRIAQLAWMIFLMVLDDQERKCEARHEGYVSPIPDRLRWSNWAARSVAMTDDDLIDFVNTDLLESLRNLSADSKTQPIGAVVRSVLQDVQNYMKSGAVMREIMAKINNSFIPLFK